MYININYLLLEISGSHSDIISDSYIFHYGNELASRTGNKEIRHFVTTNYDQKYPFATVPAWADKSSALYAAAFCEFYVQGPTWLKETFT